MIGNNKRGFACVSLVNPKTPSNVGSALRACGCYGVAQFNVSGARGHNAYKKMLNHETNTTASHRHIPTFITLDPLSFIPNNTEIVVVEIIDGATPLPIFSHPQRALYVFGPEDGSLGNSITSRAHHIVSIPTNYCMNLSATVNVVLYDRMAKGLKNSPAYKQYIPSIYEREKSA